MQNIVSFVGLFCKRDLSFYRSLLTKATPYDSKESSLLGPRALVSSLKFKVSFAEYRLFCRALLQKRLIILSVSLAQEPHRNRESNSQYTTDAIAFANGACLMQGCQISDRKQILNSHKLTQTHTIESVYSLSRCPTLPTCGSVLQCVAVCCSVLQRAAMCCGESIISIYK